jgi:hypothetical protein
MYLELSKRSRNSPVETSIFCLVEAFVVVNVSNW